MFNQNYRRFETKELSVTFKLILLRCNKGQKMRVEFCIFGKVNFIGIKTSRQLTCLYIGPLIFSVYVWPKISKKINLLCIL